MITRSLKNKIVGRIYIQRTRTHNLHLFFIVSDQVKAEIRDLVLEFHKLKATDEEKYNLFITELERHLDHDEESLNLAEDFKSFVFTSVVFL